MWRRDLGLRKEYGGGRTGNVWEINGGSEIYAGNSLPHGGPLTGKQTNENNRC